MFFIEFVVVIWSKSLLSTQTSYRNGNVKNIVEANRIRPFIENSMLKNLLIRAYAIRPYEHHYNIIVIAWKW